MAKAAKAQDILVQVSVCGVCHTELDEIEGRTPPTSFPMILGHQVVGTLCCTARSKRPDDFRQGIALVLPGFILPAGTCKFCRSGQEKSVP